MDESEALRRFGLRPAVADLPALREILAAETRKESAAQGDGDTELMKLCCVQLFHAGLLEDVARIWAAKRASFSAGPAWKTRSGTSRASARRTPARR